MKKFLSIAVLMCFCSLVAPVHALVIEAIEISQANAVAANFDAGTGTITWGGGSLGSIITNGFKYQIFTDVTLTATISGVNDTSVAPIASATFDTSNDFVFELKDGGITRFKLEGTLSGLYSEGEIIDGEGLDGRMVMNQTGLVIDEDYFLALPQFAGADEVTWSGGISDALFSVGSSILFSGFNPSDYQSNYSSNNATITVYADEAAVPEPATLAILGLGSLLALRRRRS